MTDHPELLGEGDLVIAKDHVVYFEDSGKKYRAHLEIVCGPLYKKNADEYNVNVRTKVLKVEPLDVSAL